MFEQAANRVLWDFQVIVLIALVVGLFIHAALGSFRVPPRPGVGSEFQPLDLVLIWFPLAFFLINPLLVLLGTDQPKPEKSALQPGVVELLLGAFSNFIYFFFIGGITVLVMQIAVVRDAVSILGLRRLHWIYILIFGFIGTALSVALCNHVLGGLSSQYLESIFGGELAQQLPIQQLQSTTSPLVIALTVLLACAVAPIVEETLFRGYLYGVIKRFSSPMFAALISGALFAVVHVNLPALLPLWMFAILLSFAYELSRCLWVPILIHSLFNGFNIINLFLSKGNPS